eukprot:5557419-Prymnesium_polylepis.1
MTRWPTTSSKQRASRRTSLCCDRASPKRSSGTLGGGVHIFKRAQRMRLSLSGIWSRWQGSVT